MKAKVIPMNNYSLTIKAAYLGYVVQAIVNNFVPLLFVRMQFLPSAAG